MTDGIAIFATLSAIMVLAPIIAIKWWGSL